MSYRYPSHRIQEIVRAPKCLREGETFALVNRGEHGKAFDVKLDMVDGGFTDLRYLGNTHDVTDPESYHASLLLDAHRIRGVDFVPVGRRHFFKDYLPAGWHQNVDDPNIPTTERRPHDPLPDFAPTDLKDFISRTAALWAIDLDWEATML